MTERTANPLDAVGALLEERQRYEGWLATLESRRAATPPHVYARVHADYERRLNEVLERLASRTGELQDMTRDLRTRVDRLQEDENARRDERAEAELRAMVGEYTDTQWSEIRESSDREIGRIASEIATMRAELARLEEVLRTAAAPRRSEETAAVDAAPDADEAVPDAPSSEPVAAAAGAAGEAGSEVHAGETAPDAATDQSHGDAGTATASEPPAPARESGPVLADPRAFDELAFLQSVVEPRATGRGRSAEPGAGASGGAEASPGAESGSAQATGRAPTPAASPAVGASATPAESPAVTDGAPVAATPRITVPGRQMPTPPEAPPAVPHLPVGDSGRPVTRESIPAFLKDIPNEQAKTLKCHECGTMNYPTEWYCERCGGELAAM